MGSAVRDGREVPGISIFFWHSQVDRDAAGKLLASLSGEGFLCQPHPLDTSASVFCVSAQTSSIEVRNALQRFQGNPLLALLEEFPVPAEIAGLPMYRTDLPDSYSRFISVLRHGPLQDSETEQAEEADDPSVWFLAVAKAFFATVLTINSSGFALATPLNRTIAPPDILKGLLVDPEALQGKVPGKLVRFTTIPAVLENIVAKSERLIPIALTDYLRPEAPDATRLISWLALLLSASIIGNDVVGRLRRRYRPKSLPTEAEVAAMRTQLGGISVLISIGIGTGNAFQITTNQLPAAERAEAAAVLRAAGVAESNIEAATNATELAVRIAAGLHDIGQERTSPSYHLLQNLVSGRERTAWPPWEPGTPEIPPPLPRSLDLLRAFLAHGHEVESLVVVKNYLQNELKMPEPVILAEKPSAGLTMVEKFEKYARTAHVAIVFLTPDDVGGAVAEPLESRARQNAIGELFWFISWFGRRSGRVIVMRRGMLSIPSDLDGLTHIDLSNGVPAALLTLTRELRAVVTA